MRKYLTLMLCVCSLLLSAQPGQPVTESVRKSIVSQNLKGVKVKYEFPLFHRSEVVPGNDPFVFIQIPGTGLMREPGKPALPALTELIVIPLHATTRLHWSSKSFTEETGIRIHPALLPAVDTYGAETPPFIIDSALYTRDAFFPEQAVEVVDTLLIRGMQVAVVQIRPVQYNPARGIVRIHHDITFDFDFGENGSFESFALQNSASYTRFLSNLMLNGNSLPEGVSQLPASGYANYLIVTVDQFRSAADSVALWREQMGFHTEVICKPSWTVQAVKDSVAIRYITNLPHPDYLLIIGDFGQVPSYTYTSGTSFYPTDLYFVCMDGSADFYPDMAKGRISVSSAAQAMSVVQKIINYERNPIADSAFYHNALHCAYFQDDDTSGYASRRFTHTSEEVRDYVLNQGYDIQRVYYTEPYINPLFYNNGYYSNGEPLPADLLKSNGFLWNGGATQIAQAINAGRFYVLHRDHGYVGGSGWASPYFTTTSINSLSNGNKTPVVFSINCHTGEFSLNECFAEKFLRWPAGGAVGVFAASYESYSGYNDALTVGMFDGIWNNPGLLPLFGSGGIASPTVSSHPPILAMGDVLNHGLLRMVQTWNGTTSSNTYQYRLLHYFGDPAMRMFTGVPSQIVASIPDTVVVGTTHMPVSGCNVNDALATLVYQNKLIASGILSGGSTILSSAPLSDTTFRALVTISKHNWKPFIKSVVIISQATALNDNPCHPVHLGVKKYCDPIQSGFAGATASPVVYPACSSYNGPDVWFSFVAPSSGKAEAELGGLPAAAGLAAYHAGCATPSWMDCNITPGPDGRLLLQLDSLISGDTILLRVWQNSPNAAPGFSICVREPDSLPFFPIPYYTGFEIGIDSCWQLISSNTVGRIRIDSVCDARYGNASLLMDQNLNGSYAVNEARLRVNLRDKSNVKLSFWWREYGDESNAEDGVFLSDNGGDSFVKVTELKGSFEAWTHYILNLDDLASMNGLHLTEAFIIKFQQYDNWGMICSNPTGGDGFAFDEIRLWEDTLTHYYATVPYATGFENGCDAAWKLSSSHPLGRIVSTGAYSQPSAGDYFLLMDVSTGSNYNLNNSDLRLNLNGTDSLVLSFAYRSFGNESHIENGVWISDDEGSSFVKVASLTDTNTYWQQKNINIDAVTQLYGLSTQQDLIIRFAQYDNNPAATDGYGLDEVRVFVPVQTLIDVSPVAMAFSADTGSIVSQNIFLINPGTVPLQVNGIQFPYAFSSAIPLPLSVPPGDSVAVTVDFQPDSVGPFTGWMKFLHNGNAGVDSCRFDGLGMYRALVPDLSSLIFDTLIVQSTDTITFQLTNPGNGAVQMSAVAVPTGFSVLTSTSQSFSPGQSRQIKICFSPVTPGSYNGFVSVTSNANQLQIPVFGFAYDPLGVENVLPDEAFRIFPNPADNYVDITSNSGSAFNVQLFDAAGRLLHSATATGILRLNLSTCSSGLYVLKIVENDSGLSSFIRLIRK
jgi:hypothetical protein